MAIGSKSNVKPVIRATKQTDSGSCNHEWTRGSGYRDIQTGMNVQTKTCGLCGKEVSRSWHPIDPVPEDYV